MLGLLSFLPKYITTYKYGNYISVQIIKIIFKYSRPNYFNTFHKRFINFILFNCFLKELQRNVPFDRFTAITKIIFIFYNQTSQYLSLNSTNNYYASRNRRVYYRYKSILNNLISKPISMIRWNPNTRNVQLTKDFSSEMIIDVYPFLSIHFLLTTYYSKWGFLFFRYNPV